MKLARFFLYLSIFLLALMTSRQFSMGIFNPTIELSPVFNRASLEKVINKPPLDKQVNILMIHTDLSQQPKLMGMWWVAIAPRAPITFVPIFPSAQAGGIDPVELTSKFHIYKEGNKTAKVDSAFMAFVDAEEIPWDGYIVLDHAALAILVDFVGGIRYGNTPLEGAAIVERFTDPTTDKHAALDFQTSLWNELCQKAIFSGSSGGFEIIRPNLVDHVITSPAFPLSFTDFQSHITSSEILTCAINPSEAEITVKLPTMEYYNTSMRRNNGN